MLLVLPAIGGFGAAPQSLVGAVALPNPFGNLVVPAGLSRVFYLASEGLIYSLRAFNMITRARLHLR